MRTIKRDIVGAFIFSSDGKLLLGKSLNGAIYAGQWLVPGGGIEPGETKVQALVREVREETGLDISSFTHEPLNDVLSGTAEKILRQSSEKVIMDMQFYNYKISLPQASDSITLETEDDFVDAQWFSIESLKELNLASPSMVTLRKFGYL